MRAPRRCALFTALLVQLGFLVATGRLRVGLRIEANWQGAGVYYPGRITRENPDGTFFVTYRDGDRERRVRPELIRRLPPPMTTVAHAPATDSSHSTTAYNTVATVAPTTPMTTVAHAPAINSSRSTTAYTVATMAAKTTMTTAAAAESQNTKIATSATPPATTADSNVSRSTTKTWSSSTAATPAAKVAMPLHPAATTTTVAMTTTTTTAAAMSKKVTTAAAGSARNREAVRTCVGWRQTGGCSPSGRREPQHDHDCNATVARGSSGYCDCGRRRWAAAVGCDHAPFRCVTHCENVSAVHSMPLPRPSITTTTTVTATTTANTPRPAVTALPARPAPTLLRVLAQPQQGASGALQFRSPVNVSVLCPASNAHWRCAVRFSRKSPYGFAVSLNSVARARSQGHSTSRVLSRGVNGTEVTSTRTGVSLGHYQFSSWSTVACPVPARRDNSSNSSNAARTSSFVGTDTYVNITLSGVGPLQVWALTTCSYATPMGFKAPKPKPDREPKLKPSELIVLGNGASPYFHAATKAVKSQPKISLVRPRQVSHPVAGYVKGVNSNGSKAVWTERVLESKFKQGWRDVVVSGHVAILANPWHHFAVLEPKLGCGHGLFRPSETGRAYSSVYRKPVVLPTGAPTPPPSPAPTTAPTRSPTPPTAAPSTAPTSAPTAAPVAVPTTAHTAAQVREITNSTAGNLLIPARNSTSHANQRAASMNLTASVSSDDDAPTVSVLLPPDTSVDGHTSSTTHNQVSATLHKVTKAAQKPQKLAPQPHSPRRRRLRENIAGRGKTVQGCKLVTNGGFFNTENSKCIGNLVSRGRIVQTDDRDMVNFGLRDGRFVIGYINSSEVHDPEHPFRELISGLIWLVRDGKPNVDDNVKYEECLMCAQTTGNQFVTVKSARTALGYDRQGRLMIVQVEGRTWERGVDLHEFSKFVASVGAWNAINLDGGGSASMSVEGRLISEPSEPCQTQAVDPLLGGPLAKAASGHVRCEKPVGSVLCFHDEENAAAAMTGTGDDAGPNISSSAGTKPGFDAIAHLKQARFVKQLRVQLEKERALELKSKARAKLEHEIAANATLAVARAQAEEQASERKSKAVLRSRVAQAAAQATDSASRVAAAANASAAAAIDIAVQKMKRSNAAILTAERKRNAEAVAMLRQQLVLARERAANASLVARRKEVHSEQEAEREHEDAEKAERRFRKEKQKLRHEKAELDEVERVEEDQQTMFQLSGPALLIFGAVFVVSLLLNVMPACSSAASAARAEVHRRQRYHPSRSGHMRLDTRESPSGHDKSSALGSDASPSNDVEMVSTAIEFDFEEEGV